MVMWQLHWWLAQGCGKTIILQSHQGEKRKHLQKQCLSSPIHFHKPVYRVILGSHCVLIAAVWCHSCFSTPDGSNIIPRAIKVLSSVLACSYCKADELLRAYIMISDVLSYMSKEWDFNLTANITLQYPQAIKCIFHTSSVIWWLLLR